MMGSTKLTIRDLLLIAAFATIVALVGSAGIVLLSVTGVIPANQEEAADREEQLVSKRRQIVDQFLSGELMAKEDVPWMKTVGGFDEFLLRYWVETGAMTEDERRIIFEETREFVRRVPAPTPVEKPEQE